MIKYVQAILKTERLKILKTEKKKSKIIRISTVILFLFILGTGCQKEEWEEVTLSNETCGNIVGIFSSLTDYSGTIKNMSSETGINVYCIKVTDPKTTDEIEFIACNLPEQYHRDGLKIIFSGEILNLQDWIDGEVEADLIGTPVKLTSAKMLK